MYLLPGSTILTNTCLVLNPFVMIIGTIQSDVNSAFIWSLTLYIVNIVVWFYWLVTASYFPVQGQIRRICITICAVKCKKLYNIYLMFKQLNCLSLYLPVDIPAYIVYIHMGIWPSGMLLKYTLKLYIPII